MLKEKVYELAKEIGIDIIGITDAEPLDRIGKQLVTRQESGTDTEFEERDLDKRINPRLTMEDCNSIIVVGMSYNKKGYKRGSAKVKGGLSMSSWGRDYHAVLEGKMRDLVDALEKTRDFNHMVFCDTGPLVDRELAWKAGLGYYGNNCSIINPEFGSFIFIGYILTSLSIEGNKYAMDSECGHCRLCIDACPTSALIKGGVLNPRLCISYLTQTKELIHDELAAKMGIKIYGCDTCQAVCPKNKGARLSPHPEFNPVKTGGIVDMEELFKMTKKEFQAKYGDMAGSWRGKTVLLRNSVIAIKNTGKEVSEELKADILKKDVELLKPYTTRLFRNMVE